MGINYYEVLEIEPRASRQEVKKAYHKQALKWHPDKNPSQRDEAEIRFKLVAEAYEVLSNDNKRLVFDQYGEEGVKNNSNQHNMSSTNSRSSGSCKYNFQGLFQDSTYMFHDPFELFRNVFGQDINHIHQHLHQQQLHRHHLNMNGHNHNHHHPSMAMMMDDMNLNTNLMFNNNMLHSSSSNSSSSFGQSGFHSHSMPSNNTANMMQGAMSRSSSTSTSIINGRSVTRQVVVENGNTTEIVIENGVVTQKTVNGVGQLTNHPNPNPNPNLRIQSNMYDSINHYQ